MKPACIKFLLTSLCAVMIIACNHSSPDTGANKTQSAIDSTEAAKAVAEEQQAFMDAFKKGDSIAVAHVYTGDAKVMNAGMPAAEGRDNIIKFFGRIIQKWAANDHNKNLGSLEQHQHDR